MRCEGRYLAFAFRHDARPTLDGIRHMYSPPSAYDLSGNLRVVEVSKRVFFASEPTGGFPTSYVASKSDAPEAGTGQVGFGSVRRHVLNLLGMGYDPEIRSTVVQSIAVYMIDFVRWIKRFVFKAHHYSVHEEPATATVSLCIDVRIAPIKMRGPVMV